MNILDNVPQINTGNEYFDTLMQSATIKVERIFSNGVRNGQWYDQEEDGWVILLHGEAELDFGTHCQPLCQGDYILIPAHQKHRVTKTSSDAIWLAIHFSALLKQS